MEKKSVELLPYTVELKEEYQQKIDRIYSIAEEMKVKILNSYLFQQENDDFVSCLIETEIEGIIRILPYPLGKQDEVFKSKQEISMN